jgi:alanine-glyoxylate transaminase/serine-glyoxylate transaminase/serine-pyruvate transaminase
MGHASNQRNILLCLAALDDALGRLKAPIRRGVAVEAANKSLAD